MIEPYQYAVRHVRQLWELPTTNHNTTFRISRLRCTTYQAALFAANHYLHIFGANIQPSKHVPGR